MTKKELLEKIEELSIADIVETAFKAWIPGKADGYCVYDPDTDELVGVTLTQNEWIPDDKRIYLYCIGQNLLGNNGYTEEDWLTPDEIEEWKKKNEELGYYGVSPEDFLEEKGIFWDRLLDIITFYAEEEGLDYDGIEGQIEGYIESLKS